MGMITLNIVIFYGLSKKQGGNLINLFNLFLICFTLHSSWSGRHTFFNPQQIRQDLVMVERELIYYE